MADDLGTSGGVESEMEGLSGLVAGGCLESSGVLDVATGNRIRDLGLSDQQIRFVMAMVRTGFDWGRSYREAGYQVGVKGDSGGILRLKRTGRVMRALGMVANAMANKVSVTKDWAVLKCKGWVEDAVIPVETKLRALKLIGQWSGWEVSGAAVAASEGRGGGGVGVQIVIKTSGLTESQVRSVKSEVVDESV